MATKKPSSASANAPDRVEHHGERVEEDDLDVEDDEEHRRQVEADREALLRRPGRDAGLERDRLGARRAAFRRVEKTNDSTTSRPGSRARTARRRGTGTSRRARRASTTCTPGILPLTSRLRGCTENGLARVERACNDCHKVGRFVTAGAVATLRDSDGHGHRERRGEDQGAHGRGARGRGRGAARRRPGRRLLRLPVRARLRPWAQDGDNEIEMHGVTRRRRPVQRSVPRAAPRSTSSTLSWAPGFAINNPNVRRPAAAAPPSRRRTRRAASRRGACGRRCGSGCGH